MRNGIYRSWFKGPDAEGASAIIFQDGRVVSSDPGHSYLGYYVVENGKFRAQVHGKRHTTLSLPSALADLDDFDFVAEGVARQESASIRCTIPSVPGAVIDIECVWICEA